MAKRVAFDEDKLPESHRRARLVKALRKAEWNELTAVARWELVRRVLLFVLRDDKGG